MTIHLWLGLSLGALFVLTGLSGSLLVFDHAIDERLHPNLLLAARREANDPRRQVPQTPISPDWSRIDAVLAAAALAYPDPLAAKSFIEPPRTPDGVWTIWCRNNYGEATGYTQVYVDPTTIDVTGCRTWGEYFVSWIYRLHDELLLGEFGRTVVGLTGLALIVSIATGIVLWWPLWKHSWRAAFALRGGRRFHYDLHKTLGIVSGVILLVIACTGVYLVFPGWVKPAVQLFSAETVPAAAKLQSTRQAGQAPISAADAAEIARGVFPEGVLKRLQFPPDPDATYVARIRGAGDVRHSSGNSRVWIDQYSGEVLAVRDWNRRTAADTFYAWQFPLHNGEAFGLVGRWVVFFTGLVPAVLYVTGFVLWWRKRQSRQRQSRQRQSRQRQSRQRQLRQRQLRQRHHGGASRGV
ncbi:PepSY-associated TM helix domain-containing protein [Candidatus Laterigemmans baculatus]|uniref:PepSY-associated TM helix domain-containing protein n=1 Tax=Candidatus Laterigemmans baculatus TaxID=2770505 RepID=UPI001F18DF13|nr:PepSY-associated TM helix domain-containing protein [Candidatus Laterigemmans baculatus]